MCKLSCIPSLLSLILPDFRTTFPFPILRLQLVMRDYNTLDNPILFTGLALKGTAYKQLVCKTHCSNLKVSKSDVQITIDSVPWHQHRVLGIHTPLIILPLTDHALINAHTTHYITTDWPCTNIHKYSKCAQLHLLSTHTHTHTTHYSFNYCTSTNHAELPSMSLPPKTHSLISAMHELLLLLCSPCPLGTLGRICLVPQGDSPVLG